MECFAAEVVHGVTSGRGWRAALRGDYSRERGTWRAVRDGLEREAGMAKKNNETQGPKGRKSPARQRGVEDSFTGRSAQRAVAAELLRLRCNAAIPEVDLG